MTVAFVALSMCLVGVVQRTAALASGAVPLGAEKYLSPSQLQLTNFPSTGRGIKTLVDRSPGEVLLKIPVNETITETVAADLPIGETVQQQLSQEQKLALTLLGLKEDGHPYVGSVLPKEHFSIWTLPQDAWNTPALSKLPRCYRESFQATRDMVSNFASAVKDDWKFDDAVWAFSMVRSRSLAAPELAPDDSDQPAPLALIPGLDLFNHQFDSGTVLQLTDGYWTLRSSRSYKADEQIFLSYGDDKDNLKLLITYGFAVKNNPNKLAFWTWEDLLEAAGAVRPSMFSERVRRSLLLHPQLTSYVALTEDRATFSFDAATKRPRESLQNGLTMLSSLTAQLGFPEDDYLQRDVLDHLIQSRVEDLNACLGGFQTDAFPAEWLPFLASTKLVLEEELSSLAA